MKYFARIVLLICFPLSVWCQNPILVVLRIDDIQSRNTSYIPKNISPFELAAESRGAKVTYVTIPHRLIESGVNNGSLTAELKNSILHGHEIAQHGYNHICVRCGSTGHEMFCDTYKSPISRVIQDSLIANGMKILKDSLGIVPRLFVSPGHYEDTTTYHLLAEHHFSTISTTKSLRGEVTKDLFNIPSTNEYTWALTNSNYRAQFNAGMNDFRTIGEETGCFVFLFHDPFIRQGYLNGIVIQWMGEMLDSLKANYGDRLRFVTLSEAADYFKSPLKVRPLAGIIPGEFVLEQNYPNPFNPTTIIRYHLPAVSYVSLKVYDAIGREVSTIVEGMNDAGIHSATFVAKNIPSGIYFVKLQNEEKVRLKKMILLK